MGYHFAIEPAEYTAFATGEDELDKCREWGLLSEKATKTKAFSYKRFGLVLPCGVVGFVDAFTAVIEFENGQRHCIHPSYLKEMQATGFSQRGVAEAATEAGEAAEAEPAAVEGAPAEAVKPAAEAKPAPEPAKPASAAAAKPAAAPKEPKKRKLDLPEDKVRMKVTVKEFAKVPNHFTEEEDEVVVYEDVALLEPEMEVGLAWSSHSNTLKKLELVVGDKLVFDAKIAAKKLLKHPVPYKINNPSKIQKE